MTTLEWEPGRRVTVEVLGTGAPALLLAHGAGSDRTHPLVAGLAAELAALGLGVATFDYPYRAEGRRRPDHLDTLLACHAAAASWARTELSGRLVLAGRSMGARMASYLASRGEPCEGLVAYAYPLHPAGRPERLRADHLAGIQVPMLFCQGSRDALSRPDLYDRHVRPLPNVTTVDLEGADHSWRIRGVDRAQLLRVVAEGTVSWMRTHLGTRPPPGA